MREVYPDNGETPFRKSFENRCDNGLIVGIGFLPRAQAQWLFQAPDPIRDANSSRLDCRLLNQ
jgi:hypothetical protein